MSLSLWITVESTIESIYVKIPESSVCASSILEEVVIRVGSVAEDLVLLDAKFLPVSNDERGLCGSVSVAIPTRSVFHTLVACACVCGYSSLD